MLSKKEKLKFINQKLIYIIDLYKIDDGTLGKYSIYPDMQELQCIEDNLHTLHKIVYMLRL